jgi:hypothetical protein
MRATPTARLWRFGSRILGLSIAVLASAGAGVARADGAAVDRPQPTRVTVGVFLNNIPSIDLQSNRFSFDAYVWLRWEPSEWPPQGAREDPEAPASPVDSLEFVDGVEVTKEVVFSRPGYCCVQVKGERLNFWDVRDYPFDRQRLEIVLEDASFDGREVVYVPDTANSASSAELHVPGAIPAQPTILASEFVYPTNFGDPELKPGSQSAYSRVTFALPVDRDGAGVFFKLFTALFVSTAIAMLALFINPTQVDPRFGLCVGGLFGIVASGYAVNSVLPDASGLSYADKLHVAALLCVLLAVLESVYSLALHLNQGEAGAAKAKRLDRLTFAALAGGYALTVVVLTMQLRG